MTRPKTLRRLRSIFLWLSFAAALCIGAVQWVVPWLGRRGNLNALIEGIIRSSLAVPVAIEKIDTEPMSHLTVTRLRSVSALAEERFQFGAGSITIEYDPIEIFGGRIRRVVFEKPELVLNLDADLQGIARMPQIPAGSKAARKAAPKPAGDESRLASASPLVLPFEIESTVVEQGTVTLRFGSRDLPLSSLHVELTSLGRALGQRFQLSTEVLGGSVRASGGVDVLVEPGKPARYAFHSANVVIDGVEASRLLEWIASESVSGAWIRSAALKARGTLQLAGTLDGTWPENLSLKLTTHANDVGAVYGSDLTVDEASLGVHLSVVCLGDAESLKFSLSTHGSGKLGADRPDAAPGAIEDAFVEIEGELRRLEGDGGVLELASSTAGLAGAGEVSFSGRIDSLLGSHPPAFDLMIDAPSLDVQALVAHIPPVLRARVLASPEAARLAGELRAKLHVTGDAVTPHADGSFEVAGLTVPGSGGAVLQTGVRGALKGLELDTRSWTWRLEQGNVETDDISAKALAGVLGVAEKARSIGGALRLKAETCEQRYPVIASGIHARGEVGWSGGSLELKSGDAGLTGLDGALSFDAAFDPASRKLALEIDAKAAMKEVLAGRFYADLSGEPVRLSAAGIASWDAAWRVESASIGRFEASSSVTGPIAGAASLLRSSDGGELSLDASLKASEIPADEAFHVFVSEPLAASAPFLAQGKLDGSAALDLRVEGSISKPTFWGRVSLSRSDLTLESFRARGLEVDLPFELGDLLPRTEPARQEGSIEAQDVVAGPVDLGAIHIALSLADGAYSVEPVKLRLHGGTVDVNELRVSPRGEKGLSARMSLHGRDLDVRRITRAHSLPPFKGKLAFDLEPILLEGNRVESHGTVTLKAFGGEAAFSDLTIENVSHPYSDLKLREGRLSGVRLGAVGEAFRFGLLSGVLEGSVKDLDFTGGELSSFDADLETVPVSGVPQYLNRGAIDSIRRVFAGPIGAIEETFFSKFRYADFGFSCRLDDGVFRFRGKYPDGETEYIMRARWYQFPRVNIINGRPDRPYDWKTIVANLRKIYHSP